MITNKSARTPWNIAPLEEFFTGRPLPAAPVQIEAGQVIANPLAFVEGHMAAIRVNNGKAAFEPYIERLTRFAHWLNDNPAPGGLVPNLAPAAPPEKVNAPTYCRPAAQPINQAVKPTKKEQKKEAETPPSLF